MRPFASTQDKGLKSAEWIGLAGLTLFTLAAVLGYWTFGLHPNLIPDSDFARRIYGLSYRWFARLHIVVSAVVLGVYLLRRTGWKWIPAFVGVALVSFLSEHIGTGYGFPFSGYEYTTLLGPKVGGRVPFLIPISWFLMALPSWVLANLVFRGSGKRIPRIILAAYLLTAWDLALDPAMSFLTPYWVWENPGPFYGMPWVNLAGWMGTGLVLMVVMEALRISSWSPRVSAGWMTAYYGLVLLMPVGMLAAAGIWGPIAAAAGALLVPVVLSLSLQRIRKPVPPVGTMKEQLG